MYEIGSIYRDKIELSICEFVELFWFFRLIERSARQSIENSVSQCKECTSEFYFEFIGERVRWAHQNSLQTQEEPQGY
jgi:hypothetical protein